MLRMKLKKTNKSKINKILDKQNLYQSLKSSYDKYKSDKMLLKRNKIAQDIVNLNNYYQMMDRQEIKRSEERK